MHLVVCVWRKNTFVRHVTLRGFMQPPMPTNFHLLALCKHCKTMRSTNWAEMLRRQDSDGCSVVVVNGHGDAAWQVFILLLRVQTSSAERTGHVETGMLGIGGPPRAGSARSWSSLMEFVIPSKKEVWKVQRWTSPSSLLGRSNNGMQVIRHIGVLRCLVPFLQLPTPTWPGPEARVLAAACRDFEELLARPRQSGEVAGSRCCSLPSYEGPDFFCFESLPWGVKSCVAHIYISLDAYFALYQFLTQELCTLQKPCFRNYARLSSYARFRNDVCVLATTFQKLDARSGTTFQKLCAFQRPCFRHHTSESTCLSEATATLCCFV